MPRHGAFWDFTGRHSILNERFKYDEAPLCPEIPCYASQEFSRSYLRHLMVENELLGMRLLSLHNIAFLFHLMDQIRYHIANGSFPAFKKDFLATFLTSAHDPLPEGTSL